MDETTLATFITLVTTNIGTIVGCVFAVIKGIKGLKSNEKKQIDNLLEENEKMRLALKEQALLTNHCLNLVEKEQRKRLNIKEASDEK